MQKYQVGTFVHHREKNRKPLVFAYLRDYSPHWTGCVVYEVEAKRGYLARAEAIRRRKKDLAKHSDGSALIED